MIRFQRNKKVFKCPRCSNEGQNLAAINYKETYYQKGRISGGGIGIGTFGIGVGVGGGTYSGVTQTKRAKKFDEPEEIDTVTPFVFLGIFVLLGLLFMPYFLDGFVQIATELNPGGNEGNNGSSVFSVSASERLESLFQIIKFIIPILGFIIFTVGFFQRCKDDSAYNDMILGKGQERYRNLYLCEHCHTLFDMAGNYRPASEDGFEEIMNIQEKEDAREISV